VDTTSLVAFLDYNTTVRPCQRHIHFSQDRDLAADNALWSRAKRSATPTVNGRRRHCRRHRRLFVRRTSLHRAAVKSA